jgi:hypothetical protein
MALLQPAHKDLGIAGRAPVWVAIAPAHMRASGQVGRIGQRQHLDERVELNRIDCVHH